jgi:cyclic beta-1,2-glucan synthetase
MMSIRRVLARTQIRLQRMLGLRQSTRNEAGESPLRAQLFSAEQMERHGVALAKSHRLSDSQPGDLLLERLSANESVIRRASKLLSDAVQANRRLTPAGDWLLDNLYLVEEQIRIARRHLPKGYSRELPRLDRGPSVKLPRVYDIALNAISHGDARVDLDSLSRFIASYQSVTPLNLGELWAIPIMLRLALIENLRRIGSQIIGDRIDRNQADLWADRLIEVAETDSKSVVLVVADMARSQPPRSSAFVAEITRRLQGHSSALGLPLTWIEQWLADEEQGITQLVQAENRQQAAEQVSISNSIGSLRLLAMMDWREFVETMSVVEHSLRADPGGTYGRMDFATRDRYRHVVERIARRGKLDESTVAKAALALAQAHAADSDNHQIAAHVGYYLIDEGRPQLAQALALGGGLKDSLRSSVGRIPLLAYILPMAAIIALFTFGLVKEARSELDAGGVLWIVGMLCVIAFSELGVVLVNWAATLLATPRALPRLDYSEGVPSESRTLVVVPTMISSVGTVRMLADALEVRFLANRDDHLHFALLTDFLDADQAVMPQDAEILDVAQQEIDALNQRHPGVDGDVFFLLHRPRVWNPRERKWMGLERKRGKLAALNSLLHRGASDAFSKIVGNIERLRGVRYVITLDTDTQLPRDAARELVGTLAHPLNRARIDPKRKIVTGGYGILQPRVGTSMGSERRSWYARLYGSEPGIDPYTRAVSDVYQDLFGEGSFVGKGIYDVDAFERALANRCPENQILSHDLLEGCYARAGLVSDVQLYEDYPVRYALDVNRRHRWIRGDWQLLPWLLPWVMRADGTRERNPLSMLSRGKVLDNLRRSLVPSTTMTLLILGWLLAPRALNWTLWVLSTLLVAPFVTTLMAFLNKPLDLPWRAHLLHRADAAGRDLARIALAVACMPYEAFFSLDAIARTLWRQLISHRRMLQWSPSNEVARTLGDGVLASLRSMWFAPASAIATAISLLRAHPASLPVAAPVLMLWALSPLLTWWIGRVRTRKTARLSAGQSRFLGRLSRRTWAFFEDFVTADDHWLPPDNIQEHPSLIVARRTSPTNIGLSLLSNLTAYDFGYLQTSDVIERTANTLRTMESMPRHRGHFYNWYDTESLLPLPPLYVSTVDSGNLAGHLLTLRQGLLGLIDAPLLAPTTWQGLQDTFEVLQEAHGDNADPAFGVALQAARDTLPMPVERASQILMDLTALAQALSEGLIDSTTDAPYWTRKLLGQCHAAQLELAWLGPLPKSLLTAGIPTLMQVAEYLPPEDAAHSAEVAQLIDQARSRIMELERLASVAGRCAQMEFGFLYDRTRHLLTIGYNVEEHRSDPGYYDLLASEARLCSFIAIAQGQLPQDAWFSLGRLLTDVDGDSALLSWSGSMFEYLMPQLVMPSYEGSLLDQTARASVARQIEYGRQRDVPWGISESGYNTVDARMNYQYRAFGVPGLGLRRGLAQDLVIAPYASMMALMVAPEAACENLQRMVADGFSGRYGMYEAIDYTPVRVPRGQTRALVRSFMVHHQGMGFLALSYLLHNEPMQRRFMADPEFQATLLLLQERIPRTGAFHPNTGEVAGAGTMTHDTETRLRIFGNASSPRPALQLLSNGRYHSMLTSAGSGYSRLHDMAVTRWREDGTRDQWGNYCYLRDVDSGEFWSTSYQPTTVDVTGYEAIFSDAKAEFRGRKNGFETHLEIAVSPEDDIELRRLRISNLSRNPRTIEVTTYAEVVMASAISDELHPAFSNLFVQTELIPERQAIVCTRRARSQDETPPWMFHLLAVHEADIEAVSYETDRSRFLGRGNDARKPRALTDSIGLSNSHGSVLDPIVAIRCRITLAPNQTTTIDMVTGVGSDRQECVALIDKYRDRHLADRVFDLAWTHSQVVRRQINASQADAQLYERLAGLVLYAHPAMRAEPSLLLQNRRGQSGLWGQAISGDHPIVLVQIADAENIELVRQMVQAYAYWRLKGLTTDLVIWNDEQGGYRQQLHDQIMGLISAGVEANVIDKPGGIFVRPAQQIPQEDRILLQSVARVIVSDTRGTLAEQLARRLPPDPVVPLLQAQPIQSELMPVVHDDASVARRDDDAAFDSWPFDPVREPLQLDNGTGAFSRDGREYVIDLAPGHATPAPWSNVLANPHFGCVVSESTTGYTWSENAHEFRLTPWHNDPISDSGGEAFYLRDEQSGRYWSPTPLPCRGEGNYRVRHGFGYSVYEHAEDGIASELWVYVARDEAVKFSVLRVRNDSGRTRQLSATGYVEWILGDLHAKTQMHVVTELEPDNAGGAVTARNAYNIEFSGRVAFFDADGGHANDIRRSVSGDRTEFVGRNGSLHAPAALARERLSGKLGAGLDPCTAIQVPIDLAPGQSREVVFRLGSGTTHDAAIALARRMRGIDVAHDALDEVRTHWLRTLCVVQVETPEPSIDLLANGWLLYQTIACRYFARSGYYQSGGAFGFRDQLQDTMAMLHAEPALARGHLLLCAEHQFIDGDVQHWWHPPLDRGVRTRCSDDYLWLPLAACRYVQATGDHSVLDEKISYIEGRRVNPDEESYYDLPSRSGLRETLYQHCTRSLQRALELVGERGLPLMETGDWNDGMNRVGEGGKGESVWLGFFLFDVLKRFNILARDRGDLLFAERCENASATLQSNLEQHAWDGAWYRRAWFDNGAPLGSTESDECNIDSISQSWSVLSGAADPVRAGQAMDSLYQRLVRRDAGLIQLLDPPFDKTAQDPGYIRGYVPGVRENGGQYTHAAIWATMAFAEIGDSPRAWELARMINPIHHAADAEGVARYKVEPYVLAADVYAVPPHTGRGGWTWYTGSAGWMYRLLTESLLGLHRHGDMLEVIPRIPVEWSHYRIQYRHGESVYSIEIRQHDGEEATLQMDGVAQRDLRFRLADDGEAHRVDIQWPRTHS